MSISKKNGYGQGTFIEAKMFLSPAWMSLGEKGTAPQVTSSSMKVLVLFLGKRQYGYSKRKGEKVRERTDGNQLTLTYKELKSHGICNKKPTRAIDELLAKGFISIVDPGGLYENHKAVYALEEDYRQWRPGDDPIRTRERDARRGYQGTKKISLPLTSPTHTDAGDPHPRAKTRTQATHTQKSEIFADASE